MSSAAAPPGEAGLDGKPVGIGAARKAWQRKARAEARHVRWLVSVYQTTASHHTGKTNDQLVSMVMGIQAEVAALRQLVCARHQQRIGSGTDEGTVKAEEDIGQTKEESTLQSGGEQLPDPWAWPVQPPHIEGAV